MTTIFEQLRTVHFLQGLDVGEFAAGAARLISEINAGHPFREGNGRTQLAFLNLLCHNAGYGFDDNALYPEPTLNAMIASFHGDLAPLIALITDLID